MIKYIKGNLFDSNAGALVNTVNLEGYMGKGIAFQFKELFPKNYEKYVLACKNNDIGIGKLLVVEENNKIIVNFPTKTKWRMKSKYEYIEAGLKDLVNIIKKLHITSIAIPPLGSGNGGLDWIKVKEVIENHLKDVTNCDIYIYEPDTNKTSKSIAPKTTLNDLILLSILKDNFEEVPNSKQLLMLILDILNIISDSGLFADYNSKTKSVKKCKKIIAYYQESNPKNLFDNEYKRIQSNNSKTVLNKYKILSTKISDILQNFNTIEDLNRVYNILLSVEKNNDLNLLNEKWNLYIDQLVELNILSANLIGLQLNKESLK